jgi:hypothetical protein
LKEENMSNTRQKMLNALYKNKGKPAFTVAQAMKRFGIVGVRQRICDLRDEGYQIHSFERPNKRTVAYGLATGSKTMLKAASRK